MSKLSGSVLILAGVAVGAYALSSRHETGTEVAAPQPGRVEQAAVSPVDPAPPAPRLEAAKAPAPQPAPKAAQSPPPAIAEAPPGTSVFQYKPSSAPPLDRAGIAKEIQRQLKRIGCYHGPADGVWSASTRRAMKVFTDRVNATLPIEQPDSILLAMVQNHQNVTCDRSCPAGQSLAANGRCLPDALVARAGKRLEPTPSTAKAPDDARKPIAAAAPAVGAREGPAEAAEGRMSLAGPPAERSPAASGAARVKAANSAARRKYTARAGPYSDAPRWERRYATRRYDPGPTGFGFPWWGVPGIMP